MLLTAETISASAYGSGGDSDLDAADRPSSQLDPDTDPEINILRTVPAYSNAFAFRCVRSIRSNGV